jgi:predicted DNA repair protein MutK
VSTGLIALIDDVVGLAKVAAASLDDAAAQATRAGAKAAGVVVDDAAVTPRYLVGFAASRELPIVGRIALGSLKNKLLYLLPAALVLSLFAPWAITPLLMLGGAFLCYEGAEKAYEALWPHGHGHGGGDVPVAGTPAELEEQRVRGAIQTDLILSAEIMAITLSTVAEATSSFWTQAIVLAIVGIGITLVVYGAVALIVKADDVGLSLACNDSPVSSVLGLRRRGGAAPGGADRALRPLTKAIGRGLVIGMPYLLKALSVVGTAAMLWVGGGILIHGLEEFGFSAIGHAIHDVAAAVGHAVPAVAGALEWLVTAAAAGLLGLAVGAVLIPLVNNIAMPAVAKLRGGRKAPSDAESRVEEGLHGRAGRDGIDHPAGADRTARL